jgi:hypothetical protein
MVLAKELVDHFLPGMDKLEKKVEHVTKMLDVVKNFESDVNEAMNQRWGSHSIQESLKKKYPWLDITVVVYRIYGPKKGQEWHEFTKVY